MCCGKEIDRQEVVCPHCKAESSGDGGAGTRWRPGRMAALSLGGHALQMLLVGYCVVHVLAFFLLALAVGPGLGTAKMSVLSYLKLLYVYPELDRALWNRMYITTIAALLPTAMTLLSLWLTVFLKHKRGYRYCAVLAAASWLDYLVLYLDLKPLLDSVPGNVPRIVGMGGILVCLVSAVQVIVAVRVMWAAEKAAESIR